MRAFGVMALLAIAAGWLVGCRGEPPAAAPQTRSDPEPLEWGRGLEPRRPLIPPDFVDDDSPRWERKPVAGVNLWPQPGGDGSRALGIRLGYRWHRVFSCGCPNPVPWKVPFAAHHRAVGRVPPAEQMAAVSAQAAGVLKNSSGGLITPGPDQLSQALEATHLPSFMGPESNRESGELLLEIPGWSSATLSYYQREVDVYCVAATSVVGPDGSRSWQWLDEQCKYIATVQLDEFLEMHRIAPLPEEERLPAKSETGSDGKVHWTLIPFKQTISSHARWNASPPSPSVFLAPPPQVGLPTTQPATRAAGSVSFRFAGAVPEGCAFRVALAPVASGAQLEYAGSEQELVVKGGVAQVELPAGFYRLISPRLRAQKTWQSLTSSPDKPDPNPVVRIEPGHTHEVTLWPRPEHPQEH